MKEDSEFNINFVSMVEKYKCLYDHTCEEYSKKDIQEKAWNAIGKELSEKAEDCKERWVNLRACYSRHLRSLTELSGSGVKAKKPYYLAEYLHFLQPFTKFRKSQSNIGSQKTIKSKTEENKSPTIEEVETELCRFYNETDTDQVVQTTNTEMVHHSLEKSPRKILTPKKRKLTKMRTIDAVNKSAFEYFESKKHPKTNQEDPDLSFLKSVLPEMKRMENGQKRRFKIGILNLAGTILDEEKNSYITLNNGSSSIISSVENPSTNRFPPQLPSTILVDCESQYSNIHGISEYLKFSQTHGNSLNFRSYNDSCT